MLKDYKEKYDNCAQELYALRLKVNVSYKYLNYLILK